MRFKKYTCYVHTLVVLTLIVSSTSWAELRRIVHPDGRVEFTNVRSTTLVGGTRPTKAVFSYRDRHGIWTFSDQRPETGIRYEMIRVDCFACKVDSLVDWQQTRLYPDRYREVIKREAIQFGVDPALVQAVIHAESAFNPKAVSPKGAQGLMQLMPLTAEELGVKNALDAEQNIRGGVKYLAQMLERFDRNTILATAAYNAGPGAVTKYRGVPPFAETQAYTERVAILHKRYRKSTTR